mmetsp:Transcript_17225/g.47129  ORF Transcript_17225/g.47129 Transcript_17225/m.47129 type:complete len:145 (+) Transcript_17225:45-479(+)
MLWTDGRMKNQTSPLLVGGKALGYYDSSSRQRDNNLVKSSSARDHLANERTYLAWVRTGLALLGASIALLKWEDVSSVTAYIVAVLGLTVIVLSTRRYFHVMNLLQKNEFEPNVGEALFIVSAALIVIVVTFVLHETGNLYHKA